MQGKVCASWQEAEALHKEVKLLQAESGQLRRDLEIKCEMEVQYAQRGALQVPPSLQVDAFLRATLQTEAVVHGIAQHCADISHASVVRCPFGSMTSSVLSRRHALLLGCVQ